MIEHWTIRALAQHYLWVVQHNILYDVAQHILYIKYR